MTLSEEVASLQRAAHDLMYLVRNLLPDTPIA